jgi:hypothetical protein
MYCILPDVVRRRVADPRTGRREQRRNSIVVFICVLVVLVLLCHLVTGKFENEGTGKC